jgi:predicted adenine nucleotide alpha hydrolase (AANH) superfamily ATPase
MFGRRFNVPFLEADFKKKDGFLKSVKLSKELGLYRQDYCGCLYSRRDLLTRLLRNSPSPQSSSSPGGGGKKSFERLFHIQAKKREKKL